MDQSDHESVDLLLDSLDVDGIDFDIPAEPEPPPPRPRRPDARRQDDHWALWLLPLVAFAVIALEQLVMLSGAGRVAGSIAMSLVYIATIVGILFLGSTAVARLRQ